MIDVFFVLICYYVEELDVICVQGLFKFEWIIISLQLVEIIFDDGCKVLNFCVNNYLGLVDYLDLIQVVKDVFDIYGFGMVLVCFICGMQDLYKQLEKQIVDFFGKQDIILYVVCFDVNGGLFELLFGENDVIIFDVLNYVLIIDGVCLCKVKCFCYVNCDMVDLEVQLQVVDVVGCKIKLIIIDGVFLMDGFIVLLDKIIVLVKKYNVLVYIDECYVIGFFGVIGRGLVEVKGVLEKIDIIIGILGKVMGGVLGGFICVSVEVIELLCQCLCLYLFFNLLLLYVVVVGIKVFEMLVVVDDLCSILVENIVYFCEKMIVVGFDVMLGVYLISLVMLYDVLLVQKFVECLFEEGIYVIGFFFWWCLKVRFVFVFRLVLCIVVSIWIG